MFCCTHSHFISSPPSGNQFLSRVPHSSAYFAEGWGISSQIRQRATQFLRCPEQSVLRRLFGRVQHFPDRPQLQSVVMLQLENHALARRQLFEGPPYSSTQFPPHQVPLGIRPAAPVRHLCQYVELLAFGIHSHRRVFFTHLFPANLVEAQIGDNPVDPLVKPASEAKPAHAPVPPEKR